MRHALAAPAVLVLLAGALWAGRAPAADPAPDAPPKKPVVAVFPVGGDAKETARQRAAQSFRLKLDRTDRFTVLDGDRMKDLTAESKDPVTFDTAPDVVRQLAATEKPDIYLWGDLRGTTLRVKLLDTRDPNARVREITRSVADPTDMRFVTEQVLEHIRDVDKFLHPNEEAVTRDARAEQLWKTGPNLVVNGDFSDQGKWHGILESQYYPIRIQTEMPAVDKMAIVKVPDGPAGKADNVLVMKMSRGVAETNGLACLSDAMKIEPKTRYRIAFNYKSDGPKLHVFVKGYTKGPDINGKETLIENYRRQVPPTGGTGGKWVEIVDDLNPQHIRFPVQYLKVDLYVYLSPGTVMFDNVVLKAVGDQTRDAKDEAIDKPVDRPKGARP